MLRSIFILFLICVISPFFDVHGQTVESIKSKIEDKNNQIAELEKEITQYQKELNATSKQTKTLQSTIKTLDLTKDKLNTNTRITENKIETTNLTIDKLALEIKNKEKGIETNTKALKSTIKQIQQSDDKSIIEALLQYRLIADFWNEQEQTEKFQKSIQVRVSELKQLKNDLENKALETKKQKNKLIELKQDLVDQKLIIEANKKEKNSILAQTKNTEAEYKKILKEKEDLRKAFEQELRAFEADLRIVIDPKSIPKAGKGILMWPLDSVFITQHFGNTAFSKTTLAYNGQGHNGVDFRSPLGSRVKSADSGVIEGVGDTDLACPGASYGKWIMVKHSNGLSTLYAHLSLIKVTKGQIVVTGDILGYSGNTGYSTGPHLHFSVFASQGVRIMDRQSRVCGKTYTMPIADLKAYLDPLIYL